VEAAALLFSKLATQDFPPGARIRPKSAEHTPAQPITSWPVADSPMDVDPTPRFARTEAFRSYRQQPQQTPSGSPTLRDQTLSAQTPMQRFGYTPAPTPRVNPNPGTSAALFGQTSSPAQTFASVAAQGAPSLAAQAAAASPTSQPIPLVSMEPILYVKLSSIKPGQMPKMKNLRPWERPPPGYVPAQAQMLLPAVQLASPASPAAQQPPQERPKQTRLKKYFHKKS